MSKALVITGANFATNAVETITLSTIIECTQITIDQDTLAFTAIGSTAMLTATVTPANTTDSIIWTSSDTSVATVADGSVTCTGIGSAIITATCGTRTATCTVTATVVLTNPAFVNGYLITSTSISSGKDYVGQTANSKGRICLSGNNTLEGYRAIYYKTSEASTYDPIFGELYPIEIPAGATSIELSFPTDFASYLQWVLVDANSKQTYNSVESAKAITNITAEIPATAGTYIIDLTSYTGYNAFVFDLRTASADASTVIGDVSITFT